MAVELCAAAAAGDNSGSSRGMSPRISFSHDLSKYDVVPIEPHLPLNPSSLFASANFNFYSPSLPSHSSSADELFSNGILLPLQHHNKQPLPNPTQTQTQTLPPPPTPPPPPPPPSSSTSSFWKFKKSRSFNCGSIYRGTLCPLLSRSKSTGSNSTSKRSLVPKHSPASSSSSSGYQKPPLNKPYGSNAPAVLSPVVLNVSSANFFGFGSIFGKAAPHKIHKKKLLI